MAALRVLLAEDEALVAMALADCLEAEGHAVAVAGTAPKPSPRPAASAASICSSPTCACRAWAAKT